MNSLFKNIAFALRIFAAYAVLCVACFLMLRTIVGYMTFKDDVQFLAFKQAYIHNPVWKTAFYIHVFSAVVALLAGFTQFSSEILRDSPKLHRLVGKIYIVNILCINFPVGLIMGFYANGGLVGKTAFLTLDVLWFYFTLKAYTSVRQRKFAEHKNYMIRSYALTFSAFTLRSWKFVLSNLFPAFPLPELYLIDSWLGFLPNLAIAEIVIRSKSRVSARKPSSTPSSSGQTVPQG
jgi:uncharacterized membrane protein